MQKLPWCIRSRGKDHLYVPIKKGDITLWRCSRCGRLKA